MTVLSRETVSFPPVLQFFIRSLALLTLLCGVAEVFAKSVLHLQGRYAYPLLEEYFPDFLYFAGKFENLHTFKFFTTSPLYPFMYPAPVALVYALFFRSSPHHALRFFLIAMVGSFVLAALFLLRALYARGLDRATAAAFVGSTLLLSYPFWFVYRQANMECAVWVVLSIGLVAFFHRKPYLAGVCFATAGAMKLFPFVYLGLLLARKQYRAIAVGIAFALGLTLVSLWVMYPDIRVSWQHTQAGVENFRQLYMLHLRPERGFDHSIFGLLKRLTPTLPAPPALGHLLSAYLLVSAIAGILLYFVRIRKLPVTNQVLCLSIASILLPPTSFDYTLIHLYAPWMLLVLYAVSRPRNNGVRARSLWLEPSFLCFAILFAPLTEFIVFGETVGGPIRCCALIALFAIALSYPFRNEEFDLPSDPRTSPLSAAG